jgi:hypothetical protein
MSIIGSIMKPIIAGIIFFSLNFDFDETFVSSWIKLNFFCLNLYFASVVEDFAFLFSTFKLLFDITALFIG